MGMAYAPVVTEPVVIQDIYASALHDVECVGEGAYRFTFVVSQRAAGGALQEQVITCRLIMPKKAILHGCMWALREIGAKCCGRGLLLVNH